MYSEVNLHSGTEGRPVCRFVTYPMTEEQKGPREPWPIFFWPNPVFALPVWSACASCLKCKMGKLTVKRLEIWYAIIMRNFGIHTFSLYCYLKHTSSNVKKETPTEEHENAIKNCHRKIYWRTSKRAVLVIEDSIENETLNEEVVRSTKIFIKV